MGEFTNGTLPVKTPERSLVAKTQAKPPGFRSFRAASSPRNRGCFASSNDIRPPGSRAERFDVASVGSVFLAARKPGC